MNMTEMLTQAVKQKASDLHISPGLPPIIRVDGELVPMESAAPIVTEESANLIYSVMEKEQKAEFEKSLEIDFSVFVPNVAGFRVNAFHQIKGMGAVFRVIPEKIPTFEQLDLPIAFKRVLDLPNGLILVTGPTGSGKSTTLAAMIDYINTNRAEHIITVEDPIEFIHQSKKCVITQRQLHRDTIDYAMALRSALRQDPDVILIGEMRDLETIRLALTAAETGHLVMATLHTSSAPRTVSRIIDVFPTGEKNIIRNMLSESLEAVICQTLLKRTSGGRIPAFEIMFGSSAIRNLIREDKVAQMYTTIQTSGESGMCTLDQYLQKLVKNQLVDLDTALGATSNKETFEV
jgi:twitching motility protein PilT